MVDASPFRTPIRSCPRCSTPLSSGELGFCARCHGVWVPEAALRDRVARMQERPLPQLQWGSQSRAPLSCVACRAPMQTLLLFEVPVDRCPAHGVWILRDALSTVLLRSCEVAPMAGTATTSTKSSPVSSPVSPPSRSDGLGVIGGVLELLGVLFGAL